MRLLRAFKTELDPNNAQRTLLLQHAGARRWAYNWGLRRKIEDYERIGKSPSAKALHRELNRLKKTDPPEGGVPWMYEVSKCAPQEALRDLDEAFVNFFRRVKKGEKPGFPRFKSKKRGIGGFRLTGTIKVFERHVQLPRLGRIRLKERGYLPFNDPAVHILSATVTEQAGRWFVSLQVEVEKEKVAPKETIGGVDLGIRALATLSNGEKFENPRTLAGAERKLKHLQRAVSRKKKGSKNRRKAVRKLARAHARVANLRENVLHEISAAIAKRFGIVGMEDLNAEGMGRNHCLAKALKDAAFGELRRQVKYKTAWSGGRVVLADRFYPSSKRCSQCKVLKEHLELSERIYRCDPCGLEIDRDLNAALNLKDVAASDTETQNACGGAVSP
ncbi:MAG TPA: RNA-guided endonuclease TnpB family protein, partial [Planctomycetota bacterium]|nr:RNA-guided endonuclease TnpB family protein [Planctomycetota bacterium]